MDSGLKLSPAQIRFLQICVQDQNGHNMGNVLPDQSGHLAQGWMRTMKSLRSRGLITYDLIATITPVGREALARASVRLTSIPSRETWNAACVVISEELGLFVQDMWEDADPYELAVVSSEAFEEGRTPQSFIEDIFGEDLARIEHDNQQADEAMQYEFEEAFE